LRTRITAGVPFVGDCFVGITLKAQMKRADDTRSIQFVSYEKITVLLIFYRGRLREYFLDELISDAFSKGSFTDYDAKD